MDEISNAINNYYYDKIRRMKIGQIVSGMPKELTINISKEDVDKYRYTAVEEYFALKKIEYLVDSKNITLEVGDQLKAAVKRRPMLTERLGYVYLDTQKQGEVDNIQAELESINELLNNYHLLDNPFIPTFKEKNPERKLRPKEE